VLGRELCMIIDPKLLLLPCTAREVYALISGEPREVIIQALIDGAGSARDDTVKVLRRIAHAMVVGSPYSRTDVLPTTS
jgi:hypothetical protein